MPTIDLGRVRGNDGVGVPTGGNTGQILTKASNANHDTKWVDIPKVELDTTLKVSGKAADAKATGDALGQLSKRIVDYRTAVNLLDNSDWRAKKNIVNQRGQDVYTQNDYTIDRWELWNGKVNVTDLGYISTTGQLYQKIDIPTDKTYTLAVKTGGGIAVATGIPANHANATFGNVTIVLTTLNGYVEVVIQPAPGYDVAGAVWAALYEGEYTIETLPPYAPKGYAVELAECQQYAVSIPAGSVQTGFANSKNAIRFNIPEMSLMRKSGETSITLSSTSGTVVTGTGSAFGLADKFSSIYWAGGHVAIGLNGDVFTNGFNVVSTYFSGSIFISRDIL